MSLSPSSEGFHILVGNAGCKHIFCDASDTQVVWKTFDLVAENSLRKVWLSVFVFAGWVYPTSVLLMCWLLTQYSLRQLICARRCVSPLLTFCGCPKQSLSEETQAVWYIQPPLLHSVIAWNSLSLATRGFCCAVHPTSKNDTQPWLLSGSEVLLCFLHCSTLADSASRCIGNTYLCFWAGWVGGGSKSKQCEFSEHHWRHRQHLALPWVVSCPDPPHIRRESGDTSPNPWARFRGIYCKDIPVISSNLYNDHMNNSWST